jgi:hypothetical protein
MAVIGADIASGVVNASPFGGDFTSSSGGDGSIGASQTRRRIVILPPSHNPTGATGDTNTGTSTPDDFTRLATLLQNLFGQSVSIPISGQPVVVPTQTSSTSPIPLLLIAGGLGIVGYLVYKRYKK